MEQVRIIIAIALSLLVFIAWDFFFVEKKPDIHPQEQVSVPADTGMPTPTEVDTGNPALPSETPAMPSLETSVKMDKPDRIIQVQTPLYAVTISENRAEFKSYVLNRYKETVDPDSPRLELVEQSFAEGTIGLNFEGPLAMDLNQTVFVADRSEDSLSVMDTPVVLAFKHTDARGFIVEKRFTFHPDSYLIDMDVNVKNQSNQDVTGKILISLLNKRQTQEARYGFQGPTALINNALENVKMKKLNDQNIFTGQVDWVAFQDRYFISCVMPKAPDQAAFRVLAKENDPRLVCEYIQDTGNISTREPARFQYAVYLGPKSIPILKSIGRKLEKAVDFGWFDFIARPCLWLMNKLYGVIPNYGIAIIILTILTKVLLWPLGSKSYKSMNDMKKIQPLMAEVREKYKDDKKRMNEEIMGLYRTYKINPMGGCLPMVVQIPVFFALYRMLYEAIELRHAPFFGWINDLSAPDRLFHFGFSIPFMEPPYGIPVLTIVMGATMFLQQKMSPPMGDPAQAKMMMFMPIIFTFIFINFSSGLVLYWLVNNILSISQQYYIQKKLA